MTVYFAQHGKSAPKDVDPERRLTEEGAGEVEAVARRLADAGVAVDVIRHSGKARAEQTAEIFARWLRPKDGVETRAGMGPTDDVEPLVDAMSADRDELYVGHLPFVQRIVSALVTGDADTAVLAFQNGGVVCLDLDEQARRWVIQWTAFPSP